VGFGSGSSLPAPHAAKLIFPIAFTPPVLLIEQDHVGVHARADLRRHARFGDLATPTMS
jgi:hypothetical protein